MDIDLLLSDYGQYLVREKRASSNTCQSYLRDLRRYAQYCKNTVQTSENELCGGYVAYLKDAGSSASTISRNIASLRSFYGFCCERGYISDNPMMGITAERPEQKSPRILSGDEVEQLLQQPQCTDLKGYRDKAMLELLYASGMRVSELLSLRLSDVDMEHEAVVCGDGGRKISLPPRCIKALYEYITFIRRQMVRDLQEEILFINANGMPMTRQGFWKIVKTYGEKAGIEKNITPHILRHSFAAHLLQNGAEMKQVQKIMGHSELSVTAMYAEYADQKSNNRSKR